MKTLDAIIIYYIRLVMYLIYSGNWINFENAAHKIIMIK